MLKKISSFESKMLKNFFKKLKQENILKKWETNFLKKAKNDKKIETRIWKTIILKKNIRKKTKNYNKKIN